MRNITKRVIVLLTMTFSLILQPQSYADTCPSNSGHNYGVTNPGTFTPYGYADPLGSFSTLTQGYAIGHSGYSTHLGVDFFVPAGKEIFSICDGIVTTDSQDFSYQRTIRGRGLESSYFNSRVIVKCTNNILAIYGHVDKQAVPTGSEVKKGDSLAVIAPAYSNGSSRNTSLDHLHFGIRSGYSTPYWQSGGFGIANTSVVLSEAQEKGFQDPLNYLCNNSITSTISNANNVTRAEALKHIMDKFGISSKNAGFNSYRFNRSIEKPNDVTTSTLHYNYIVSGYNKGIVQGSQNSRNFYPDRAVNLAELLTMIVRAIPIPINNPDYDAYPYDSSEWYYETAKAAYNAGVIGGEKYSFTDSIDSNLVDTLIDNAYEYFMGRESGISIYARWTQKYVDLDLYLYDPDLGGINIETENNIVSNLSELRNSSGIVYWGEHASNWGANLDYDSWGGNGSQPWSGVGEERITVDSLMIRRPGKYSIMLCYYDWGSSLSPDSVDIEWWGISGGRNINQGGENFISSINKDKCLFAGTLSTQ